ncbi:hypothetical protein FAIPA1_30097 [Frankia sp. AiPs1]
MKPARKAAMFAAAISGRFANFLLRNASVPPVGRWYSQLIRPRANMFFARSASFLLTPPLPSVAWTAVMVIEVSGTRWTTYSSSVPSVSGSVAYPAFFRFPLVNASVLTMRFAPEGRSFRFAFSAAGFIATRTSGASPGVRMSWSEKCNWNPDTPAGVPAGARISAGKSGSVDRSLPNVAVSLVNCSPVSCIPSPESPAKRTTTRSSRRVSLSLTCSDTFSNLLGYHTSLAAAAMRCVRRAEALRELGHGLPIGPELDDLRFSALVVIDCQLCVYMRAPWFGRSTSYGCDRWCGGRRANRSRGVAPMIVLTSARNVASLDCLCTPHREICRHAGASVSV